MKNLENKSKIELSKYHSDIGLLIDLFEKYLMTDPNRRCEKDNPFNNKNFEETVNFLKEYEVNYENTEELGLFQIKIWIELEKKLQNEGII